MATSAVCVTGLAVVDPGSAFNGFGQGVSTDVADEPMASLYRGDRVDPRVSDNVVSLR